MYHNLERKSPWTRDCPRNYFILRKKRQGEKQDAIYYGGWVKVPEKDAEHLHRFPARLFSFSSFLDAPLLSHYSWPSSRPFSYIFNGKWYSAGHLLSSEYIIEKNDFFVKTQWFSTLISRTIFLKKMWNHNSCCFHLRFDGKILPHIA